MKNDIGSALFGLIGVVLGVILTHFSKWIEDIRVENKKTSKKIYYKVFPELKLFFLNEDTSEKQIFSELKVKELKKRIECLFEENIDFLDKKLYSIFCDNLKSDEYYESLGYAYFVNINHLETFAKILSCMYSAFKKQSMIEKNLLSDIDELKYCYKISFLLMDKFQNWYFVNEILQGKSLYQRTFKEIYKNKQVHKLLHCKCIEEKEFYDMFLKYCFGEIDLRKAYMRNNK